MIFNIVYITICFSYFQYDFNIYYHLSLSILLKYEELL